MKNTFARILLAVFLCCIFFQSVACGQPEYEIISLGLAGESVSGGQAVSEDGQFAAGFTDNDPFLWQSSTGTTELPPHPSRAFSTPWGVNDAGKIAGIGATTFFGSSALPIIWENGAATLLPLPSGESLGRAYAINNFDLVVGSVDGGSVEQAATFTPGGTGDVLTQTLNGGVLRTAYGVNDQGRIVGSALDPNNAAVTKGYYLDAGDSAATDIGALSTIGHNSAIAFDVSSNGLITGSSSFNGGVDGRAFLWSETGGMIEIGLPAGTSTASGRGVNADGWVVGTAGGVTAVPFLYDASNTYRLEDIIVKGGAGWDLISGTSNGAFSIADNGTIVGRANLNGQLTAFAMVLLGSEPVTVPVESFEVIRGVLASGGVAELGSSDDADVSARRNSTKVQSIVEIESKATTTSFSPSSFTFVLEASVFARTAVNQTIYLYDYQAEVFEEVDTRPAQRFSDLITSVSPSGDLSRFVESGTGCILSRVEFQSLRQRQRFSANADQIIWQIE